MKVKFLRDYRGRETGENLVKEGESWDIDPVEIKHLVNEEVIEKRGLEGLPLFAGDGAVEPVKAVVKKAAGKKSK